MDKLLAFAQPGKLGDCLCALPTARYFCEKKGMKCDFYTSDYCEKLRPLYEYQSFINKLIVPEEYVIHDMGCGVQPWYVPIDKSQYEAVWQLGFRRAPYTQLHQFIACEAGIQDVHNLKIKLECPDIPTLDEPYIVIGPRCDWEFVQIYEGVIDKSPLKVVLVGADFEVVKNRMDHPSVVNKLGLDFLETTSWISKAKGYVGVMSAMSCLSHAFDYPKVLLRHDDHSWDMTQAIKSRKHFYPIMPTPEKVLELLGLS